MEPLKETALFSAMTACALSGGLDGLMIGIDLVAKASTLILFLSSHIKIQGAAEGIRLC